VGSVADAIEIGVFQRSDGGQVTIQRASRAIEQGVTRWIGNLRDKRRSRALPILMGHLNPFLAGIERLAIDAARSGVAGLIVPDLPLEESGPLRDALAREGLALIQLVTPVTSDERLARICDIGRGFIYAVTVTGTTGDSSRFPPSLIDYLHRVRAASTIPVLAGFGIRNPEQVRELGSHADGVVVGSALIEALERGEDAAAFLGRLVSNGRS
jgi:tryptophan synthase alpha chain